MTSWVAIDETRKVTGPTRDQLVPQELPYGTSASAFGLRAPSQMQATAGGLAKTMALGTGSVDLRRSSTVGRISRAIELSDEGRYEIDERRYDIDQERLDLDVASGDFVSGAKLLRNIPEPQPFTAPQTEAKPLNEGAAAALTEKPTAAGSA